MRVVEALDVAMYADKARKACDEDDRDKSIMLWREIFGAARLITVRSVGRVHLGPPAPSEPLASAGASSRPALAHTRSATGSARGWFGVGSRFAAAGMLDAPHPGDIAPC